MGKGMLDAACLGQVSRRPLFGLWQAWNHRQWVDRIIYLDDPHA